MLPIIVPVPPDWEPPAGFVLESEVEPGVYWLLSTLPGELMVEVKATAKAPTFLDLISALKASCIAEEYFHEVS